MFLEILAGAGALSGIGSFIAGNEAADAASDAAAQNSRDTRYMFDRSVELSEPWRQSGVGALGIQNALLGVTPQETLPNMAGGDPNAPDFTAYVDNYSDLGPAFHALSPRDTRNIINKGYDANGDGRIDRGEYGRFHYTEMGRGEGRKAPITGGGPSAAYAGAPGADPAQGPQDAYQSFLDSGFAKSMLETTEADFDRLIGAFGAGGTAMSGPTLNALNDVNRRNTSTAFNNYYNALSGMSGTGANLSQAQGQQGLQAAGQIGANNMAAAHAAGSSYLNAANAFGNVLQGGANTYAYGKGQGWF